MTERQSEYRAEANLDHAHNALLEAGDLFSAAHQLPPLYLRAVLETEALEDELLTDGELFTRMALLYANYCRDCPSDYSFLEFAVDRIRRERTTEHTKAWERGE